MGGAFSARDEGEALARRLVERIALALQASLLVRGTPDFVADAFCEGQRGDADDIAGLQFGALPGGWSARSWRSGRTWVGRPIGQFSTAGRSGRLTSCRSSSQRDSFEPQRPSSVHASNRPV